MIRCCRPGLGASPPAPLVLSRNGKQYTAVGDTNVRAGTAQKSLDALRKANATSYYKGKDALWVKVVSAGDSSRGGPGSGTCVLVSR